MKMFKSTTKSRQIAQLSAEQWNDILEEFTEKLGTPRLNDVFEKFVQMHSERDDRNEVRARGMQYFIDRLLGETDINTRLRDLDVTNQTQQGQTGEKTKAFANLVKSYNPDPTFIDEGGKPGFAPF